MRTKHVTMGIATVAAGLMLTGCGWGGFAGERFTDEETIRQKITKVLFDTDSGAVEIRVGDTTSVRREVNYDDEKPGKTYRVDRDTLIIEACETPGCSVAYDVVVPEGTTVSGHVDSGAVELIGVASANVESESGPITVRDVPGEVNASLQSGTADLSGIGGKVVASAESGSLSIELSSAQDVSAQTQSGDIEVTVPKGSYEVRTATESGTVDNAFEGGDGTGEHKLDLRAESGNITVKAA